MSNKYFRSTMLIFAIFFYYDSFIHISCVAKRIRYLSTEHPNLTYINPRYASYANMTSRRHGRRSPFYYVDIHYESLIPIYNNGYTLEFFFYEYLTNVYKRSFIEMHFEFCDFIQKDNFFGAALRQGRFAKPCPYPPGEYHFYNMSVDVHVLPRNFPFRKGRIYANLTQIKKKELVGTGYVDMEIKEINIKS